LGKTEPLSASSQRASAMNRLVALATWTLVAGFVVLSLRGIDSTFLWGHDGYQGGEYGIRARHTLRDGSLIPSGALGWAPATPNDYYLHHPVLGHYIALAGIATLGDREGGVRAGICW
jgi:hypothetical protein